jgi:opacity protein-like surface antigen
MRKASSRLVIAAFAALLAASAPAAARAAGAAGVPAGGAPSTEAKPASDVSWGIVARGAWYGIPDAVAGEIFYQHPAISGWTTGAELRYFGDGGKNSVSSVGLAFDYGKAEADGTWQAEKSDDPTEASGSATMTAVTLTAYWNLFPSWVVHPYLGLGIGGAYFEGEYEDDDGTVTAEGWLPVLHIPVGLAFELGEHVQLSAEARFIDGFTAGGALQLRF